MREFFRYYFLKVLLVLVALQLVFFFWLEKRNHRPVAVSDQISVYEGHSVQLKPLRNDTDKDDSDELSIFDVSTPLKGSVEQNEDLVIYNAIKGFVGVDSFAYQATDGKKSSKPGYIKINVNENLPPMANNDEFMVYPGNEYPIPILGNDIDREGDSIIIKEITTPLYGEIIRRGNEIYYKAGQGAVLDSFHYIIGDDFSASEKTSVKIEIKSKSSNLFPWLSADIGIPTIKGNSKISNGEIVLNGSGDDIWNNSDNFHFAYQILEGDCEIITRIKSMDNTNEWAKGGIMIRESLTGPSKNVYICLSKSNGSNFQYRIRSGESTASNNINEGIGEPYWFKLTRKGNLFTGYCSVDGKNWAEVGKTEMDMPNTAYAGLATTSHNNETLCAVRYDKNNTIIKKK